VQTLAACPTQVCPTPPMPGYPGFAGGHPGLAGGHPGFAGGHPGFAGAYPAPVGFPGM
jgi:hypothetical protein